MEWRDWIRESPVPGIPGKKGFNMEIVWTGIMVKERETSKMMSRF